MRLDRLQLELRSRNAWEAMDLGIALAREHFWLIFKASLISSLPYFVVINAIALLFIYLDIGLISPLGLATVAVWWIKPVFDRIPAYVLSRAAFDATPTLKETIRIHWRGGLGIALQWVFFRRLYDWGRALTLTSDLLEQQTGKARRDRRSVLHGGVAGQSIMLTFFCLMIEWFLVISIFLLAIFLLFSFDQIDEKFKQYSTLLADSPPLWLDVMFNAMFWLVSIFISVFYMGAGFGLYLQRRTQLEAWDLELSFRRLRERVQKMGSSLSAALLVCTMMFGAGYSAPSMADDEDTYKPSPAHSLRDIFSDTYQQPDQQWQKAYNQAEKDPLIKPQIKVRKWEAKDKNWNDKSWLERFLKWLLENSDEEKKPADQSYGNVLGFIVQNLGWILLGVLVIVLLITAKRWLPWFFEGKFGKRSRKRDVETHEILLEQQLPDDVPGAARKLWQQGAHRGALALLYRAGVAQLTERLGIHLPPGCTESECLRYARRVEAPGFTSLFKKLVLTWQRAAYAHRWPNDAEFEQLLSDWPQLERAA
jgi:hypothetical protein